MTLFLVTIHSRMHLFIKESIEHQMLDVDVQMPC